MVETEGGLNPLVAQPVVRRHQIVEGVVLKGCVVHTVVADLLWIIGETWHSQQSDAVISRIVGGPCRDLVTKLHLCAVDLTVPREHLVEMTGLHGDVMKLRLNHHFFLCTQRTSAEK